MNYLHCCVVMRPNLRINAQQPNASGRFAFTDHEVRRRSLYDTKYQQVIETQQKKEQQNKHQNIKKKTNIINPKKTKTKKTSSSVFDRLSNPTLFSGIHQHRFDPITGRGKGIAGRSLPSKGPGHVDKSQRVHVLLRPKKYKPPKKYVRNGKI